MTCVLGSNYNLVLARIVTNLREERTLGQQLQKRKKDKRIQLDLETVEEEDWENFRARLDKDLQKQDEYRQREPRQVMGDDQKNVGPSSKEILAKKKEKTFN